MTTQVRKALERLERLEVAVKELTARVSWISEAMLSLNQRSATQREAIQRHRLDFEGLVRSVNELHSSTALAQEEASQSFSEIRAELKAAAYVTLVPTYSREVVSEPVSSVIRRVADAAAVELVALNSVSRPARIEARKQSKGGLWPR
jgi:hypothetical protein